MSVIGSAISLGGGKIPQPSGSIYSAGTWNSNVFHGLVSGNGGVVSEHSSYVRADGPKSGTRYGGAIVGPLRFGAGYTAAIRGPTASGQLFKLGAVKDINNIVMTEGAGTTIGTDAEISIVAQSNANETSTVSINTTSFAGQIGFVYAIFEVFTWSTDRTDARITGLTAT